MDGFGAGAEYGVAASPPPVARPMYELRPLSTGEILDRTFTLYRRRFWLYAGLSAVAAAVTTVGTFARLTFGSLGMPGMVNTTAKDGPMQVLLSAGISLLTSVLYLLAYGFTQAATVSAVAEEYLGRETSIGAAFRAVRGKWWRYVLIAFWMGWSGIWLMLALIIPAAVLLALRPASAAGIAVVLVVLAIGSLVYGVIAYIRNSLGIVACVAEGLGVRASMRRSKVLVAGHKGRVFLLFLLMWALALAVGVLQGVPAVFAVISHGWGKVVASAITLVVTFLSGSVVGPVGAIAFCLFYIDQRVRKEGYDVEMLMERVTGVAAPPKVEESVFGSPLGGGTGDGVFSTPLESSSTGTNVADENG